MDLGITNRVAMVLGAGGGLGGAIADALAAEGARVAACDISDEALRICVDRVTQNGGTASAFPFDLANLHAAEEVVGSIESALGHVEILVNITGGPPPTKASGVPADDWRRYFDSMVASVIHLTDRVLPQMRQAGWGRIVTSTSSGVITPIPNLALSNSLRASLVAWSKTLSGEVASDGVTANIVAPGRISTGRIRQLNEARAQREGRTVEEVSSDSTKSIPAGRYGFPTEYADVVTFLSSERASFISGSVIRVDGGMIPSI